MIQRFADWLVYGVFGMSAGTHAGNAVDFFVYDSVKILLLLFSISLIMGVVNAYFPIDELRRCLAARKLYGFQYLLASLFGAVTPFCSCSSIPLFIGFVKGGIPLGVTLAFLITSPLVNEVAVAMFLGSFGLRATMIYVVSGILLGTARRVPPRPLRIGTLPLAVGAAVAGAVRYGIRSVGGKAHALCGSVSRHRARCVGRRAERVAVRAGRHRRGGGDARICSRRFLRTIYGEG